MSTVDSYQEDIINIIADNISHPIVLRDQTNPKMDYPFIAYKFITKLGNEPGQPILDSSIVTEEGEDWFKYTHKKHYNMILSLTSYSNSEIESNNVIEELYDFMTFTGLTLFKNKNIIIKNIGDITERDTLIIDDYERRFGFDVEFRITKELIKLIETIEDVEYT